MGNRPIPAYIKELIFMEAAKRLQAEAEFIEWIKNSKGETGTLRVRKPVIDHGRINNDSSSPNT